MKGLVCAQKVSFIGCLPFNWKNWLVEHCSNGMYQSPEWKFPWDVRVPFPQTFSQTFPKVQIKAKSPGDSSKEQMECTAVHCLFGNFVWEFWTTFQEISFPPEMFHLGKPNQPFHLHSNRNFLIFWINGKQPLSLSSHGQLFQTLMVLSLVVYWGFLIAHQEVQNKFQIVSKGLLVLVLAIADRI